MKNDRSLLPCALLGLSLAMSACVGVSDDETEGEATSQLSAAGWSTTGQIVAATWRGDQVATLDGVTYSVTTGLCGIWNCNPRQDENELHWTALGSSTTADIPAQHADSKVSLAAFNGYLYMVHTGGDDGDASTWISKFSPSTQTWTPNLQIPYTSFAGPPAIVAYNNLLYFIGTRPGTGTRAGSYDMWYATMTASELFSSALPIPAHTSASRPSAAVLFNKLYIAHRLGTTGEVGFGSFDGTTWTPQAHIPGGDAGGPIRGLEPVIAADNGILHLVHQRPGDPFVWWTYFDGCHWAPTETTTGWQSSKGPSLTQGGPGLIMILSFPGLPDLFDQIQQYFAYSATFTHPASPFPPRLPTCGIVVSP